ncbi:pol protein [Cucumis melo var. makuwa]|uniref:Pol protein n=1 Tax=Cucumis melo var. makuwa TaxID=1194695 RepID=A0A5A7TJH0_CUCMM|nr:pol protein [Cucumis melo var. makuwa]
MAREGFLFSGWTINSYQATIGIAPFEAPYGKCCRSLVCWGKHRADRRVMLMYDVRISSLRWRHGLSEGSTYEGCYEGHWKTWETIHLPQVNPNPKNPSPSRRRLSLLRQLPPSTSSQNSRIDRHPPAPPAARVRKSSVRRTSSHDPITPLPCSQTKHSPSAAFRLQAVAKHRFRLQAVAKRRFRLHAIARARRCDPRVGKSANAQSRPNPSFSLTTRATPLSRRATRGSACAVA